MAVSPGDVMNYIWTDIDAISAREKMMLEKAAKLIRYIAMVPPVLPSTIPEIELLALPSVNPSKSDVHRYDGLGNENPATHCYDTEGSD